MDGSTRQVGLRLVLDFFFRHDSAVLRDGWAFHARSPYELTPCFQTVTVFTASVFFFSFYFCLLLWRAPLYASLSRKKTKQ